MITILLELKWLYLLQRTHPLALVITIYHAILPDNQILLVYFCLIEIRKCNKSKKGSKDQESI